MRARAVSAEVISYDREDIISSQKQKCGQVNPTFLQPLINMPATWMKEFRERPTWGHSRTRMAHFSHSSHSSVPVLLRCHRSAHSLAACLLRPGLSTSEGPDSRHASLWCFPGRMGFILRELWEAVFTGAVWCDDYDMFSVTWICRDL